MFAVTPWLGVKNELSSSSGAVSPAARAIASTAPVMMPETQAGSTMPSVVRQRLMPSASAASRWVCGTSRSTSCVERAISGTMMIASAIDAVDALLARCRCTSRP